MVDTRKLLMTKEEIEAYNERILKYEKANVIDLSKVPLLVEVSKVIALIEQYDFGSYRYINGRCFDEESKQRLLARQNLEDLKYLSASDKQITIAFGIVTTPADVRSFPTTDVLMESKEEWRFDYFQETKLKIGEGVCIYHHTTDGDWLFVQAKNYAGWVQSSCIQQCSREAMLKRIRKRCYLPYTTANVMKQAFQYLNTPYSWGNKGCGLDCSGVMLAVYESFGFSLPRNTSAMAACKDLLIDIHNLDSYEKKQLLKTVLPGSMLLMNGHVVMYLGIDDQTDAQAEAKSVANNIYVLHAFSKYFDDEGKKREVMACAITTMDIKRKDGSTFLEGVHSIWELLPKKRCGTTK